MSTKSPCMHGLLHSLQQGLSRRGSEPDLHSTHAAEAIVSHLIRTEWTEKIDAFKDCHSLKQAEIYSISCNQDTD